MPKKRKPIRERREEMLARLSEEYRDTTEYAAELRRALASFKGAIPENSPYRYLQISVGDSIVHFLTRYGRPQTVEELTAELKAGHCLFGAVKTPEEITKKAVVTYVSIRRLIWMDKKQTKVGLPAWKKR